MGGLGGAVIGGIAGDAFRTTRPKERQARRELSRNMQDLQRELAAYKGQVAPMGQMWDEQFRAGGARLQDVDQALGNVFNYLQGASGYQSPTGTPTGLGASVLARQREQIGRGTAQGARQIQEGLAQRGLGRSGLAQRLLSLNAREGASAQAQAETGLRTQAINQLGNFATSQLPLQLQRMQTAGDFPFRNTEMIQRFLDAIAKARAGRSNLFGTEADRRFREQEISREHALKIFSSIFGGIAGAKGGGIGAGGGGAAGG